MSSVSDLRPFATPQQLKYLDAIERHGSQRKAAKALGVASRTVERSVASVKRKAALQGWSPDHDMTRVVPDGFQVKGVSTLYDGQGAVAAQWVKSQQDRERIEAIMREAVQAMAETIPREKPVKPPKRSAEGLLNLYPITDYHLGAKAWHEETGADWDTSIAEQLLVDWFTQAIASSPDAEQGVLALLGDLLHYDSLEAVTPAHGNILDADTRYAKLVRVAIRVLRRIIRMLLGKHESLHIIVAEGNHDESGSVWLREWLAALYDDEPRVTVDQSPDPYYCYVWGDTFLAFHHGHLTKPARLDDVLVAKFREQWGPAKHGYAHVGHLHHSQVVETNLLLIEQHRTLAAPDSYASRHGYMAGRGASVVTYSREHGEVGRVVIGPQMCGAA